MCKKSTSYGLPASGGARAAAAFTAFGALVAAIAVAPGCSRGPERRPNVLLISIDSLRADHLDCYGYRSATGAPTSPTLDRFAREGVVFEHALSTTSWTRPSHHALLTGLPDLLHGGALDQNGLAPERVELAQVLQDAGYATAGFYSGPYLGERYRFGEGFDSYSNASGVDERIDAAIAGVVEELKADTTDSPERRQQRLSDRIAAVIEDEYHRAESADRVSDAAIGWLDRHAAAADPFFLFVHYFDVHYDYAPPEERYAARFWPGGVRPRLNGDHFFDDEEIHAGMQRDDLAGVVSCYDGEILWVDEQVGRLLKRVDELGLRDDTLVVVVSDHGDEFFEHGAKGHRQNLFAPTLDVALLARLPARLPANRRVAARVSLCDVAPTIVELAGVQAQADARAPTLDAARGALVHGMWGRSLLPLVTGSETSDRDCIAFLANRWQDADHPVDTWALATGPMKVVVSWRYDRTLDPSGATLLKVAERRAEVFDLARDAGETVDLSASGAPAVETAIARFDETFAADGALGRLVHEFNAGPPPPPLTETEAQKLAALGYPTAGVAPAALPKGTKLFRVLPPLPQFPRNR